MQPFENLIRELGNVLGAPLHVDARQSCLLNFPAENIHVQIDLDSDPDRILIGTQLGQLLPGSYREQMLFLAMQVNGRLNILPGILAYSEKNDTLILFEFLPLAFLTAQQLEQFLQIFIEHAKIWVEAIRIGEIPFFERTLSRNPGF